MVQPVIPPMGRARLRSILHLDRRLIHVGEGSFVGFSVDPFGLSDEPGWVGDAGDIQGQYQGINGWME